MKRHFQEPPVGNPLVLQMLEETFVESVRILHFFVVVCIQPFAVGRDVKLCANRVAPPTVLKNDKVFFWKLSALCMNAYPFLGKSELTV